MDTSIFQEAVMTWLRALKPSLNANKLQQLSDPRIFLALLEDLPYFRLNRPIVEQQQSLQYRIKTMKLIYESLRSYYQMVLLKDCSRIRSLDMSALAMGCTHQILKMTELIIGAFMGSDSQKHIIDTIINMKQQHQEVFMMLIENANNITDDIEKPSSSPIKIKGMLTRIEQLEEENSQLLKNLQNCESQCFELRDANNILLSDNNRIKQDNKQLQNQIQELTHNSNNSSRNFEIKVMEEKLSAVREKYEAQVLEQRIKINDLERRVNIPQEMSKQINRLTNINELLNKQIGILKKENQELIQLLKDKDQEIMQKKQKNRAYQQRILRLERQVEETKVREYQTNKKIMQQESHRKLSKQSPASYRCYTNLDSDMVHELMIENSRLNTALNQNQLDNEEEYEKVLKIQKQRIEYLEQELKQMNRKHTNANKSTYFNDENNNGILINTTNSKINKEGMSTQQTESIRSGDLMQKLTQMHKQEVNVLLSVIFDFKNLIQEQKKNRIERKQLFLSKLQKKYDQ